MTPFSKNYSGTIEADKIQYPIAGGATDDGRQGAGFAGGRNLSLMAGRAGEAGQGIRPRNRRLRLSGRTVARTSAFFRHDGLLGPEKIPRTD